MVELLTNASDLQVQIRAAAVLSNVATHGLMRERITKEDPELAGTLVSILSSPTSDTELVYRW
jgi:hypothetical protein